MSAADLSVVIPTLGRPCLTELLQDLAVTLEAAAEPPDRVVVVDDRPEPDPTARPSRLAVPARLTPTVPVVLLRSGGRGPAAARNVGWLAADSAWVSFLDDDVRVGPDWYADLQRDLTGRPPTVGAVGGRIVVPPPPGGRRPTDEERRTTGLAGARWITADLAYRREALRATGGFDERFPRAFREDSDLAVRTQRAGFTLVTGHRVTVHPLRSRGGWWSSVRAQAGNADNALLRRTYGARWRTVIGEGRGRTAEHLLTVGAGLVALTAAVGGRRRLSAAAGLAWLTGTTEQAVRRILPGPRTRGEVAAMILTSAVIPPAALGWRVLGELRWRRTRVRPARAILFDRDGTLIHDVPYLTDPDRVDPVPDAREVLQELRSRRVPVGVVSNQSGVGRGLIRPLELVAVNQQVDRLLGPFDTWQVCPHRAEDGCRCRKPEPGLVRAAARELGLRPAACVVVGDIGADLQAALRAGARAVLVPTAATRPAEIDHARRSGRLAADLRSAVGLALAGRV